MITIADPVTLWFAAGVPIRMVWRGRRLRVSDAPTELTAGAAKVSPMITHAPVLKIGWRFQAEDSDGINRVFDVRRDGDGWVLDRVYD